MINGKWKIIYKWTMVDEKWKIFFMNKKVFIIGSGGREHALGWKLKQSPKVGKIYFAPGNGGTLDIGENIPLSALDPQPLLEFAVKNKIDLTVVGPDDALAAGVVNIFRDKGLKIFGPTKEAAQIEASKAFTKQLMKDEKIPTAAFKTFTEAERAKAYVRKHGAPIVIKASGLALGKGVTVAKTLNEALAAIENSMVKKVFGKAGEEIVIEEFLQGPEVSIHVFTDGKNISIFPTSRDHKPIFDGNKGPNTGGMGTIAPLTTVSQEELEVIKKTIVLPVIRGMKKRDRPFTGLLYPGLMITKNGPKVIEFNARFGDPETQSYMRLLKTDLYEILLACAEGTLSKIKIEWSTQSACCIVIASEGYPGAYKKGVVIEGFDNIKNNPDIVVFHAGTKYENGKILTNGGRVLGITAIGKNLDEALTKAYKAIGKKGIHFEGMQYRRDIGKLK